MNKDEKIKGSNLFNLNLVNKNEENNIIEGNKFLKNNCPEIGSNMNFISPYEA